MNVLRNTIGIFAFAMILLAMIILFSISSNIMNNTYNQTKTVYNILGTNTSKIDNMYSSITGMNEILISGINFLIMLVMILTIYSSFISRNTLTEYVGLFIINLVISSIVIYAFHMIYNAFVLNISAVSLIDLNIFSDFIFVNFDNLILLNTLAFLISFIFKQRSTQ